MSFIRVIAKQYTCFLKEWLENNKEENEEYVFLAFIEITWAQYFLENTPYVE